MNEVTLYFLSTKGGNDRQDLRRLLIVTNNVYELSLTTVAIVIFGLGGSLNLSCCSKVMRLKLIKINCIRNNKGINCWHT